MTFHSVMGAASKTLGFLSVVVLFQNCDSDHFRAKPSLSDLDSKSRTPTAQISLPTVEPASTPSPAQGAGTQTIKTDKYTVEIVTTQETDGKTTIKMTTYGLNGKIIEQSTQVVASTGTTTTFARAEKFVSGTGEGETKLIHQLSYENGYLNQSDLRTYYPGKIPQRTSIDQFYPDGRRKASDYVSYYNNGYKRQVARRSYYDNETLRDDEDINYSANGHLHLWEKQYYKTNGIREWSHYGKYDRDTEGLILREISYFDDLGWTKEFQARTFHHNPGIKSTNIELINRHNVYYFSAGGVPNSLVTNYYSDNLTADALKNVSLDSMKLRRMEVKYDNDGLVAWRDERRY